MVLGRKLFSNCFAPTNTNGKFKHTVNILNEIGVIELMIILVPTIPPSKMFAGTKNSSKANAATSARCVEETARGLIGYRGEFMTDTKGNGILNTVFEDYGPYKGDIAYRKQGSLIAFESGETVAYGLFNAQDRGTPVSYTHLDFNTATFSLAFFK